MLFTANMLSQVINSNRGIDEALPGHLPSIYWVFTGHLQGIHDAFMGRVKGIYKAFTEI